jgi:hypothetical protein
MTVTTEAPAHTLADAKTSTIRILLDLAALTAPDTYECQDCAKSSIESMCHDHAGDAAVTDKLIAAAARVRDAQTADAILAILIDATEGGETL